MKVFYFIQGWIRYYLYYGKYRNIRLERIYLTYSGKEEKKTLAYKWNILMYSLLPNYIREQIRIRINSSRLCVEKGQCNICKCDTPALQMANKACDKPCYPAMMNKKKWIKFKTNLSNSLGIAPIIYHYDKSTNKYWTIFGDKFIISQEFEKLKEGELKKDYTYPPLETINELKLNNQKINWNE